MSTHLKITLWSILVLTSFTLKLINAQSPPLVTIDDGNLMGRVAQTVGLNKPYNAFQGIPFAVPPIGNLRFKPPVPTVGWNGTINATQDKSQCTQNSNPVSGSEDCLYINVYTPSPTPSNLPVMVWIYGGGFITGNSSYRLYGPDYFLDQDVVFVSFNYRLGIFGFLSTGDLTSPGNNGMRDQVLALKWVQKNIAKFGGNPNNVTIFGESAGSASVSYLLQSPLSEGLFQAAIMESGSSLCLWALTRRAEEIAIAIGDDLNVDVSTSEALVDSLRVINYLQLQESSTRISNMFLLNDPLNGLTFSPVIEPEHTDAFLSERSHVLLSSGNFHRVPTIIGYNSNEAAGSQTPINIILGLYFEKYLLNSTLLIPIDMNVNQAQRITVGRNIRSHYFNLLPAPLQFNNFVEFVGDDQFVRPIRETVLQQSKFATVYFYKFSYEGQLGGISQRSVSGVGHTEELGYLFRNSITNAPSNDALTRSRLVKLWTNFAKFSNPTPNADPLLQNISWPIASVINNVLIYTDIGSSLQIQVNPNNRNVQFWQQLYSDFGHPPYDTY